MGDVGHFQRWRLPLLFSACSEIIAGFFCKRDDIFIRNYALDRRKNSFVLVIKPKGYGRASTLLAIAWWATPEEEPGSLDGFNGLYLARILLDIKKDAQFVSHRLGSP